MGYESKIYIVEKSSIIDEGKKFAQVVAMFDLEKISFLSDKLRNKPATDCYIYADDGNTRIVEDCYGKPLTETTIDDVISILDNAVSSGDNYRRIFPLLATLKALEQHSEQWRNLAVLHFGY